MKIYELSGNEKLIMNKLTIKKIIHGAYTFDETLYASQHKH